MTDMENAEGASERDRNLTIPWSRVSLGLMVITAASLGSLVVVATIKEADVLSTVALALAVLAFAAQLVISIAQGQAANQQLLQSERINTETRSSCRRSRNDAELVINSKRAIQHGTPACP